MSENITSKNITSRLVAEKALFVAFFALLIFRDFFSATIPLYVFTIIWVIGLRLWDHNTGTAFTVAATICFTSSISITIPIAAYIAFTLYKRGSKFKINIFLLISVLIAVQEYCRFSARIAQSFAQFANTTMVIFLVATVITEYDFDEIKPETIIKYYLSFYTFLIVDIIYATIKHLGSFSMIISDRFRIGITSNFNDENTLSLLSMNANGIALLTVIAIMSALVLLYYKKIKTSTFVCFIAFASLAGFLTVSKSFILVYSGSMILWFVWYSYRNQRSVLKTWGVVLVFILSIIILLQTPMISNVFERFNEGDLTTGRTEIAERYLEHMSEQNFFVRAFGLGLQKINAKAGIPNTPHNAIVEIYVTMGYAGLIYYALFFYYFLKRPKKLSLRKYGTTPYFLNYIPFITYFVFIQGLQFARITYIYALMSVIFSCMVCCNELNSSEGEE